MYVCKMCSILPSVVQYMYRQPCWILAVTMQYIAVGEVYVLLPAVQHIAAGVQYICRQPCLILPETMQYIAVSVAVDFFQLCSLSAAGRAGYLLLAVPDIADDYAIYRRRLCNAPVCFRTDIPAETDLTARPPRHSRCRTLAPGCRRSASRCRRGRRAQSRWRAPRRRGRYTSRTDRCSSGRR